MTMARLLLVIFTVLCIFSVGLGVVVSIIADGFMALLDLLL